MSQDPKSIHTFKSAFAEAARLAAKIESNEVILIQCAQFAEILSSTLARGNKVFVCGNGGSHCDAMHFAEEMTGRFRADRRPLGVLALGDASHITCVANDYGFEHVFSRQLEALARPGDLLVVLSTSGNSPNILRTLEKAKSIEVRSIGLLGRDGGKAAPLCDQSIIVPGQTTDRIQELHMLIIHTAIEVVEQGLGLALKMPKAVD